MGEEDRRPEEGRWLALDGRRATIENPRIGLDVNSCFTDANETVFRVFRIRAPMVMPCGAMEVWAGIAGIVPVIS